MRRATADRWNNPLTPKVSYRIRKLQERARYAVVKWTWEHEFEVGLNETRVGVQLDKMECGCGYWQLKGIPCVHALACLNTIRHTNIEDYTDHCFHTETWRRCYSAVIHSIPSKDLWPQFSKFEMLQPPENQKVAREAYKQKDKGWC